MCIDAFKAKYKKCKIIYICIAKQFNSQTFEKSTIYEDYAFYYNGINNFSKNKCKELGISYYIPLYPWEILEQEKNHPDDLGTFRQGFFPRHASISRAALPGAPALPRRSATNE